MPTIFSRIIAGEIPGRFLWRDDQAVAFLDVRPLAPGHALVVPIAEVDHWTDLDAALAAHLTTIAHIVGNAQRRVFDAERIGLLVAGFEVPHVHLHVIPARSMRDFDFSQADTSPDPVALDTQADQLRAALRDLGHSNVA